MKNIRTRRRLSSSSTRSFLIVTLVLWLLIVEYVHNVVSEDLREDNNNDDNNNDNDEESSITNDIVGSAVEPHPDPNLEDYPGMIYVGRLDPITGVRLSNEYDNKIRYIFGTAFDEKHKDVEIQDLMHAHNNDPYHDVPDSIEGKTREEILRERRHKNVSTDGPKPFGYVDINELDGGVTPVSAVSVEPFFLDATPVSNKEFAKFVQSTYYVTDAERYGWSYVLRTFVSKVDQVSIDSSEVEYDPDAEHWMAVKGAYWRQPEGPSSTYKYRENHPVVHVSHHDAAEYCSWMKKRLPGEREYEAAARAHQWYKKTPDEQRMNRSLYTWGDTDTWNDPSNNISMYANLWGPGEFPTVNLAQDGWRSTSPVQYYPPNVLGFHDTIGNVWEWMRGGKLKSRIVRGASYVDTLRGEYNHAATLGSRAVVHGTTTTGNVGFRCCKTPKKRVEHHYQWHDEVLHGGSLAIEDQYGKQHMVPEPGWEDIFDPHAEDDENIVHPEDGTKPIKRKVVRKHERLSTEL